MAAAFDMLSSQTLANALLTEEPDDPTPSNLYRSPLSYPAPVKSFERECKSPTLLRLSVACALLQSPQTTRNMPGPNHPAPLQIAVPPRLLLHHPNALQRRCPPQPAAKHRRCQINQQRSHLLQVLDYGTRHGSDHFVPIRQAATTCLPPSLARPGFRFRPPSPTRKPQNRKQTFQKQRDLRIDRVVFLGMFWQRKQMLCWRLNLE